MTQTLLKELEKGSKNAILKKKIIAHYIYNEIEGIYPNPENGRGVLYTDALYEIKNTLSPSVLLEVAFHDNEEDAKWITQNIENIGIAIAKGIDNYFNQLS